MKNSTKALIAGGVIATVTAVFLISKKTAAAAPAAAAPPSEPQVAPQNVIVNPSAGITIMQLKWE